MLKHILTKHNFLQHKWKWVAFSSLLSLLFIIGLQEVYIKDTLFLYFSKAYNLLYVGDADSILTPTATKITNKIVSMSYRLLYCSICLLTIQVYFWKLNIIQLAVFMYVVLFVVTVVLYVAAELSRLPQLHVVAFRVDTLLVSPMLLIILISAIYLAPNAKSNL